MVPRGERESIFFGFNVSSLPGEETLIEGISISVLSEGIFLAQLVVKDQLNKTGVVVLILFWFSVFV